MEEFKEECSDRMNFRRSLRTSSQKNKIPEELLEVFSNKFLEEFPEIFQEEFTMLE